MTPKLHRILLFVFAAGLFAFAVCGCTHAEAQEPPSEARSSEATSVLHDNGLLADFGQVASGSGLGGDVQAQVPGMTPGSGELVSPASSPSPSSRNPLASDWLEVWYGADSRHVNILTFKGHSRAAEFLDVYAHVDFESGVDQDAARFRARVDLAGVGKAPIGPIAHLEDFSGSRNDHVRFGMYWTPWIGGADPWFRLDALPVGADGAGMMARGNIDVALRDRWSADGFFERAWGDDGGDFTAVELGPRYEIVRGKLFGTLIYRYDDRQDEPDGFAFEVGAGL